MDSEKHKLFLRLLLEHQPKIQAYILTLVPNNADADDVLQNVSEIIWRRFDQFEPGTNFLSWALRCAHFEILNFRKKKSRLREIIYDNETFEQILPVLNDEMKNVDPRRQALEQCLKKLKDSDRKIIQMRYNHDLRPKEISKSLGYTLANIYKVISRIHRKLLFCIERTVRVEGNSLNE